MTVKLTENNKEVEISDSNWALAEPLLSKRGYFTDELYLEVKDLDGITLELSAWGIPWKRTNWDYA